MNYAPELLRDLAILIGNRDNGVAEETHLSQSYDSARTEEIKDVLDHLYRQLLHGVGVRRGANRAHCTTSWTSRVGQAQLQLNRLAHLIREIQQQNSAQSCNSRLRNNHGRIVNSK